AGAREILDLLEGVDGVEQPRVERACERRRVVELVQAARELRDGRASRAVGEPRQDDGCAQAMDGVREALVGTDGDADAVRRQASRVELDPHGWPKRVVDDDGVAARDRDRELARILRPHAGGEDESSTAGAAAE